MPGIPTPNPDGHIPTDVPEFESIPDLTHRPGGSGSEFSSTSFEAERIWVGSRIQADEAGDNEYQWVLFNRFRLDNNTPRRTEWRTEEVEPPEWRTVELGDGQCQQQRKAVETEYSYKYSLLLQYYEQWETIVLLEEYYDAAAHPLTTAAGIAGKFAGLFGALKYNAAVAAAESGAVATTGAGTTASGVSAGAGAGGAAAVVAVGVGTFLATTAIMSRLKSATTVRSTGWEMIGKTKIEERPTGATREAWVDVGNPYPCPKKRPVTGTAPTPTGSVGPQDPGTDKSPAGSDRDVRSRLLWWLLFGLLAVVLVIGAIVLLGGSDDTAGVSGVDGADPVEDPTPVADPVDEPTAGDAQVADDPEPAADPPPFVLDVPDGYGDVVTILRRFGMSDEQIDGALRFGAADGMGDGIYSASDYVPGNFGDDVDIWDQMGILLTVTQALADAAFNDSVFECGETVDGATTVCSADAVLDVPAGEVVTIVQTLSADAASEPWTYTHAATFDRDGDPTNDFVAQGMFDWDYFQGTDSWYVLDHVAGEWTGGLFHGSFADPRPSGFRAVISGTAIVWFIPASELPDPSGVRTTAFRHDGTFQPEVSGGDVFGADPTEPLQPLVPTDIVVDGLEERAPGAGAPAEPADERTLVTDFVTAFDTAHDDGDVDFLRSSLAPQVLERYGAEQCASYLVETVGTIADLQVVSIEGPVTYTYPTDGLETAVDGSVYAVTLDLLAGGTPTTLTANYRVTDGTVGWFTDCGDPRS